MRGEEEGVDVSGAVCSSVRSVTWVNQCRYVGLLWEWSRRASEFVHVFALAGVRQCVCVSTCVCVGSGTTVRLC